jgi:predicted MPP superfamily phosphohydrolase
VGCGLRLFHISDLHMRSVDGPQAPRARMEAAFRWQVLGERWEANLAELRTDGVPFDLVVFTGDLGDWGHAADYPRAIAFLKQTCATLGVPLERLSRRG